MPVRDIIVIGTSAGGVEALKFLVSSLPPDLEAAIFIVLHVPAWSRSELPAILTLNGHFQAVHPQDGTHVRNRRIFVAPPDRHMLLENGSIRLSSGPKENRQRPSVNALFRSASLAYGPRVIGVILTGMLDDGTAGLWEIKRHGGIAVVQEPSDALYPEMPQSAIQNVPVDYSVPLNKMASLLTTLTSSTGQGEAGSQMSPTEEISTQITCPECRGPISEVRDGNLSSFNCRVGHKYSPETFLAAHAETRERTLWAAVVALEEGAEVARDLATRLSRERGEQLKRDAARDEDAAKSIRQLLGTMISGHSKDMTPDES
jgi:two-component system chemotaxis response regulator CheB